MRYLGRKYQFRKLIYGIESIWKKDITQLGEKESINYAIEVIEEEELDDEKLKSLLKIIEAKLSTEEDNSTIEIRDIMRLREEILYSNVKIQDIGEIDSILYSIFSYMKVENIQEAIKQDEECWNFEEMMRSLKYERWGNISTKEKLDIIHRDIEDIISSRDFNISKDSQEIIVELIRERSEEGSIALQQELERFEKYLDYEKIKLIKEKIENIKREEEESKLFKLDSDIETLTSEEIKNICISFSKEEDRIIILQKYGTSLNRIDALEILMHITLKGLKQFELSDLEQLNLTDKDIELIQGILKSKNSNKAKNKNRFILSENKSFIQYVNSLKKKSENELLEVEPIIEDETEIVTDKEIKENIEDINEIENDKGEAYERIEDLINKGLMIDQFVHILSEVKDEEKKRNIALQFIKKSNKDPFRLLEKCDIEFVFDLLDYLDDNFRLEKEQIDELMKKYIDKKKNLGINLDNPFTEEQIRKIEEIRNSAETNSDREANYEIIIDEKLEGNHEKTETETKTIEEEVANTIKAINSLEMDYLSIGDRIDILYNKNASINQFASLISGVNEIFYQEQIVDNLALIMENEEFFEVLNLLQDGKLVNDLLDMYSVRDKLNETQITELEKRVRESESSKINPHSEIIEEIEIKIATDEDVKRYIEEMNGCFSDSSKLIDKVNDMINKNFNIQQLITIISAVNDETDRRFIILKCSEILDSEDCFTLLNSCDVNDVKSLLQDEKINIKERFTPEQIGELEKRIEAKSERTDENLDEEARQSSAQNLTESDNVIVSNEKILEGKNEEEVLDYLDEKYEELKPARIKEILLGLGKDSIRYGYYNYRFKLTDEDKKIVEKRIEELEFRDKSEEEVLDYLDEKYEELEPARIKEILMGLGKDSIRYGYYNYRFKLADEDKKEVEKRIEELEFGDKSEEEIVDYLEEKNEELESSRIKEILLSLSKNNIKYGYKKYCSRLTDEDKKEVNERIKKLEKREIVSKIAIVEKLQEDFTKLLQSVKNKAR